MTQQIIQETKWPRVAIIILNWNGWKDTIECLESLLRIDYPNCHIIVVDNGSSDDSIEKIKSWARGEIPVESSFFEFDPSIKPVLIIEDDQSTIESANLLNPKKNSIESLNSRSLVLLRMKKNMGFAGGSNIGIIFALRDPTVKYIWLLNNDTVVPAQALTLLVNESIKNPAVGILSPKICYYSRPDCIWFAGGKLGYLRVAGYNLGIDTLDSPKYDGLKLCTFITGCAMLIKRELVEAIGLLDPLYFLYYEDVDFSWRAINEGWDLGTYLDSVIYHKVSSSTSKGPRWLQTYYISRNRPYLAAKYYSLFQWMAFNSFWILSRSAKFFVWMMNGRFDLIRATIKGYLDYRKGHMGMICE